jgi:CheY-like chemotaxis protein
MTCKVLLVDDDPDIREVVSLVLEPYGFETFVAADGTEALGLVRSHPDIDVILVDLMMPRLSGAEMVNILKSDAALRDIPVVVLSGDNLAQETARTLGAAGCLRKPVELSSLVATIHQFARHGPH